MRLFLADILFPPVEVWSRQGPCWTYELPLSRSSPGSSPWSPLLYSLSSKTGHMLLTHVDSPWREPALLVVLWRSRGDVALSRDASAPSGRPWPLGGGDGGGTARSRGLTPGAWCFRGLGRAALSRTRRPAALTMKYFPLCTETPPHWASWALVWGRGPIRTSTLWTHLT